jgi:hypothetical protein
MFTAVEQRGGFHHWFCIMTGTRVREKEGKVTRDLTCDGNKKRSAELPDSLHDHSASKTVPLQVLQVCMNAEPFSFQI